MAGSSSAGGIRVALEVARRKVFATALDWPGWCRGARDESSAIESLLAYWPRYRPVVERSGLAPPEEAAALVEETLEGGTATDFGAPTAVAADERRPTSSADGDRLAALLAACWHVFDEVAAQSPESLRKGPRGGGRDRSAIVAHVVEAERANYARRLGVRHRPFAPDDPGAIAALRRDVLNVLRRPSDGAPVVDRGWTCRFAARYMAWHVLDHAWEIEDRSQ
jgi:hypothetical protein